MRGTRKPDQPESLLGMAKWGRPELVPHFCRKAFLKTFSVQSGTDCAKDLSAAGLTADDIRRLAGSVNFQDAVTNGAASSAGLLMLNQMKRRGADFSSAYMNNTVLYYAPNFWQQTFSDVLGTMVHEFAHVNSGIADSVLESKMGTIAPSNNVSKKLAKDCFGNVKNP